MLGLGKKGRLGSDDADRTLAAGQNPAELVKGGDRRSERDI
jgi:hypothetical protein